MPRFDGKSVLITGGSRGIGFEIAKRFAQEGADLFIAGRSLEKLKEAKEKLMAFDTEIAISTVEISDQTSVQEMVSSALKQFGKINILVNNAGIHKMSRFSDYSLEDFDEIMKVNLYGVFHACQAVLPSMKEMGEGKIINIASTAGKGASRNQSAYNASKHAVVGLTRCLALEMADYKINVNAICPGFVQTDLVDSFAKQLAGINEVSEKEAIENMLKYSPQHRFIQPEEVAAMAAYLASPESYGVTGQAITIDGGYQMF